jgi:hypothetical protein
MQTHWQKAGSTLAGHWRAASLGVGVGMFALAALQAGLYVLLGKSGLFDVAAKWGTKSFVTNGFPFATLLLSAILAAPVALGMLGVVLWRQTRSLTLAAAVIAVVLAVYLAGTDMTASDWVASMKEPAKWYHKLTS